MRPFPIVPTASVTMTARPHFARDERHETSFISGGRSITVEWLEAAGPAAGPGPAIVMLHGADGLAWNERYRVGAQEVAAGGYHVALVHYLDRTNERRASFATLHQNFLPWMETLRDAITWVASRPGVDRPRIGVLGVSLGAALALSTAPHDRRIKVIVDYFGPLPQPFVNPATLLPPTLILHGAADPIVPAANAYALENLLKVQGVPYDIAVYPGQGHGLTGDAQRDASRRVVAFLGRYLEDGASQPG